MATKQGTVAPVEPAAPAFDPVSVDKRKLDQVEFATKAYLAGCDEVEVNIPRSVAIGSLPVIINGYRLNVPVGVRIKVPAPVAELVNTKIDAVLKWEADAADAWARRQFESNR